MWASSFHAVYWPALLMAAGIAPPKAVLSHGHWTMRDEKMSKSRGNVADPFEAIETWGVDTIRFYLMRAPGQLWNDAGELPALSRTSGVEGLLDGRLESRASRRALPQGPRRSARQSTWSDIFSEALGAAATSVPERGRIDLQARRSATVAGSGRQSHEWHLGASRYLSSRSEERAASDDGAGPDEVDRLMGQFEIPRAVDAIFRVIAEVGMLDELRDRCSKCTHQMHRRMQETEPWKQDRQPQQAHRSLFLAAETLRFAGILLQPVMPRKAAELLDALGIPPDKRGWLQLSMKAKIPRGKGVLPYSGGRPSGLFPALKKTVEVLPAA